MRYLGLLLAVVGLSREVNAEVAILPPAAFERDEQGLFICELTKLGIRPEAGEYFSGDWAKAPIYPTLYFGDDPMTLAREPDTGWFTFPGGESVVVTNLPASGYSMSGYWRYDWAFETLRVASVTNGIVSFRDRHTYGFAKADWLKNPRRFYAENHPSFLNAPGEWYLDREKNLLSFIPPADDLAAAPIRLVWGRKPVFALYGVTNRVIRGETIAFGGNVGVEIRKCCKVTLDGCTIKCVAGKGIDIDGDSTDITITNCTIHTVGRGGIILSGGNRRTLSSGNNRVVDCTISNFSFLQQVYAPAVWIYGCGNEVADCEIFGSTHSAIFYNGNEHRIVRNDIHDVVLAAGDAGALYTGRDWTSQGNLVAWNHIHDIGHAAQFVSGVYVDDCDCGDKIVSNRFERIDYAVVLGGGRDNVVADNEIIDCNVGVFLDSRGVTWTNDWNNPNKASWNFSRKAKDLDYQGELWRTRYPHLAKIMEDEPRLPKYNEIRDNRLTRCQIAYEFRTRPAIDAHLANFFDERTSLYYGRGTNDTEDCAILTGLALELATRGRKKALARRLARGLIALAYAGDEPGHVCRGIGRDGTVNRGSSRDQITHFVHALFHYHRSGLADAKTKVEVERALAAVADRMLVRITATCDGEGVLKMWHVKPHEAARLPMIYLAAWRTTGAEKYRRAYEKYVDIALEESRGVVELSEQERRWTMPGYAFLQMNASLELIRIADRTRAASAERTMAAVARLAALRFVEEDGADGPWLSAAGDLALAVALTAQGEEVKKLLGEELYSRFIQLYERCRDGVDGQPPLWEASSPRIFSILLADAICRI